MTSTNLIQQFFRQIRHDQVKMTTFKPGQIFFGKITKLYPNQMAEVTVGQQKLIAHLETPLLADERYWFQVQPGEGKVHLKVLSSSPGMERGIQANLPHEILSKLMLPQSKENLLLVRFLMKEQLPMTKDMLMIASEWIKQTGDLSKSLQTMKEVMIQQLPFTEDVLSSIRSTKDAEPIFQLIAKFQAQLKQGPQTNNVKQLSALLADLNTPIKEKTGELGIRLLVDKWLFGNDQEQKTAYRLLQTVGIIPKQLNEQSIHSQLLQPMIAKLAGEQELAEPFKRELVLLRQLSAQLQARSTEEAHTTLRQLSNQHKGERQEHQLSETVLTQRHIIEQSVKAVLQSLLTLNRSAEGTTHSLIDSNRTYEQIVTLLSNDENRLQNTKLTVARLLDNLFSLTGKIPTTHMQFSRQEQLLFRDIEQQLKQLMPQWENKAYVQRTITEIVRSLGLNFENELLTSKFQHVGETLKPLLIRYLTEQPFSQGRDHAEQLIHRLTGMQLLSQESGPLQQTLLQIPLQLWDKTIDLTMQWSGQKTAEGKIDPNYCRVLFYLQLEHLNETVIDLQVQNRIMNISIMNDHKDLKDLGKPFTHILKKNIEKGYYKLSSISFGPLQKQAESSSQPFPLLTENQYMGVDIRI